MEEITVGNVEWYQRSTWTPEDQADFQARLKRSRGSSNKAQYLRLQALALQDAGTEVLLEAAVGLLDQLLRDYPDSSLVTSTYRQRAECLADLGRYDEALANYQAALEAQRQAPN